MTTDLVHWLAETSTRTESRLGDLHRVFCDRLAASGVPLWRSSLGLEVLHPELSGAQFRWIASESRVDVIARGTTTLIDEYKVSPVRVVDETNKPYRRKLDQPIGDMPLLEDLRKSGATDYVIFPLPFLDRDRSAHMSHATQRTGGFSDSEIATLEDATRLFSPYAERIVLRRIAINLLDTYLGHRSGERVYSGAIGRGMVDTIRAAICMADIRDFTRYADEQPIDAVLATLNDFFDVIVAALEQEGAEVLKYMGDAVLAIFPEVDGSLIEPCRAAITGVQKAIDGIATLNGKRNGPPIRFGLVLHEGEVAYGNIGSRTRLDFTVIGPAVNHTSRLLELTKKLDRQIVISGAFKQASGLALPRLGRYRLRDVKMSHEVFVLPENGTPNR